MENFASISKPYFELCVSSIVLVCLFIFWPGIMLDTLEQKTSHQGKGKPEIYGSDIEFLNPCFL